MKKKKLETIVVPQSQFSNVLCEYMHVHEEDDSMMVYEDTEGFNLEGLKWAVQYTYPDGTVILKGYSLLLDAAIAFGRFISDKKLMLKELH